MLALSMRARLASFSHAYRLAIQLRRSTGRDQFVVRTGDPLQPIRVVSRPPDDPDQLMALVM